MHKKIEVFQFTDDHRKVLESLNKDPDLAYYYRHVEKDTGFDRAKCEGLMKELRKKGYAQYVTGLFDDDGQTAGSGFAITPSGVKALYE